MKFLALIFSFFLLLPTITLADEDEYVLLTPLPGMEEPVGADSSLLGNYFSSVYQLGVSLVILLAVAVLILGGIQYMMTDSFTKKGEAKDTITAALVGILLAVGSYTLLTLIIGDKAVTFDMNIEAVEPGEWSRLGETCTVTLVNRFGNSTRSTPTCRSILGGFPESGRDLLVLKEDIPEIIGRINENGNNICRGTNSILMLGLTYYTYEIRPSSECSSPELLFPIDESPVIPPGPSANVCHDNVAFGATRSDITNSNNYTYHLIHKSPIEDETYTITIEQYYYDVESGNISLASGNQEEHSFPSSDLLGDERYVTGEMTILNPITFSDNYPGIIRFVLRDSSDNEIHEFNVGIGVEPGNCR